MQLQSGDKAEASGLLKGIKEKKTLSFIQSLWLVTGGSIVLKILSFSVKKKIILKGNGNTAGADTKVVEANLKHFNVYEM